GPYEDPPFSIRVMGQPEYQIPRVYQWSFSAQHRFSANWSAHLDYVGSRAVHNHQFVNLNAAALPVANLADVELQNRHSLTGLGIIGAWVTWGWKKYDSSEFGIKNRKWKGLYMMVNFTRAKNLSSSRFMVGSAHGNTHCPSFVICRGR